MVGVAFVGGTVLACAHGSPVAETTPGPPPDRDVREMDVAVLETSLGTVAFRFFEQQAPRTVANVRALIEDGFYDGTTFYRVVAGHVAQFGTAGENGRPTVPGEFGAYPHVEGVVGLARGGHPDSGSTELYICLAARPHLDGNYATFGILVEGWEVLRSMGAVEVEERWEGEVAFHRPQTPIVIERAWIERRVLPSSVTR